MTLFAVILLGIISGVLLACALAPFILSGRMSARERIEQALRRVDEAEAAAKRIEAAETIVASEGDCMTRPLAGLCDRCPFIDEECDLPPEDNLARAQAWPLSSRASVTMR